MPAISPRLDGEEGPIRVLFLLSHLHKGGMQRAVSNISQALPRDIEQHVGYFGSDNPGYVFCARVHDFGIPGSTELSWFTRVANAVRRARALRRYVRDQGIGAVVSFGESANLYNLTARHGARRLISIRVAVEEQLAAAGRAGALLRLLTGLLYPRAERVVCVSEELARRATAAWPKLAQKVTVINNLYHLDVIQALAREPLPPEYLHLAAKRYVLAVGSFVRQKGLDLLIDAFARASVPAAARLVLLGGGELKQALIMQATALGIADKCEFIDFDPNPYRYMARSAVFVLPSRFEGFPNVLVEAMACGAAVVAFDCPTGPREILGESEFGLLVPPLSSAALAGAIGRILGSPEEERRYRDAAIRRSEDYGAPRIAHEWQSLLLGQNRIVR